MELLEAPAFLHELARQPIEKLRMRWTFALQSKVARRCDDSAAKMILPDAIYHHASGQWIIRISQNICQSRAPSAGALLCDWNHLRRIRIEQREKAWLYFFLWFFIRAAAQDKNRRRLSAEIGHPGGQRQFSRIK